MSVINKIKRKKDTLALDAKDIDELLKIIRKLEREEINATIQELETPNKKSV